MSNLYRYFIYLFIAFCTPTLLSAKHLIGGEMSYKCLGNGDYEITLRVYRDCLTDGANFDRSANFSIFQCDGTIDCTELEQGNQGFKFEVPLDTVETINYPDPTCELPQLCVEQGIYRFRISEFESFLPTTDNSYHIVHQRCCRNGSVTNIENPGEYGNTFTIAIMPAAQQVCNTSPTFENFPPVITCINQLFEFQQIAIDAEGDSLVYSFSDLLHGGGDDLSNFRTCGGVIPDPPCPPPFAKVPFITPIYDAAFPFGDFDETIEIKPNTGLITGTPTLIGQFVVGLSVKEYRNGILLSTSQREFQINVINCEDTNDRIGSDCDDGNSNTEQDRIQEDCSCRGVLSTEAKNGRDLFISEYVESSTSTKCIELYNPINQTITLNSQYKINIYNEENPDGITLHTIDENIPPFTTYLICHEASDTSLLTIANATFSIDFDGNDAISIEQGNTLIDLFGNRECFPNNLWRRGVNGNSTRNRTLVRCPCIRTGIKVDPIDCEFNSLSEEWIGFQENEFRYLGTHDTLAEEGSNISQTYCACEQPCRTRDSTILADLYKSTNGENWFNKWDLSQPINTWFGVTLDEEGCVSCLDLDGIPNCNVSHTTDSTGNNLVGILPDQISELENLTALYLGHNQLEGLLPRNLGNLTKLQKLWLNNNNLTGDFPIGLILLDNLQQINLSFNQLTGNLPPEMADLEQLVIFGATDNQLTGCFPESYLKFCDKDAFNARFENNDGLSWKGDFDFFCEGSDSQIGANCDDQDEETLLDAIQIDCTCKGEKNIQPLLFSTPCRTFKKEEENCLPFQVSNFKNLRGIQMYVDWNPSVLEFTQIQTSPDLVSLSQNSFNQEQVSNGQLELFWADENSILGNDFLDGDTLFKICFIRQTLDTAIISINEDSKVPFPSMAVTADSEIVPISNNICNPTHGSCRFYDILGELEDPQLVEVCSGTIRLSAESPPEDYTGQWVSSNQFVTLSNPTDTELTINQLPPGSTYFSWVLDTVNCTSYIPEIFEVIQLVRPVLQTDTFIISDKEVPYSFSIKDEFQTPNLISNLIDSPSHGVLNELGIGQFELLPASTLKDQDQFQYEVCYEICPTICASSTFVFQLQEPVVAVPPIDENLIPNTITPNEDGLNDLLVFPQLVDPLAFPENELLIFNRWGDQVFITRPYDNTWGGTDGSGNALPEGTYYYILRLDVGMGNVLRGEVVILR